MNKTIKLLMVSDVFVVMGFGLIAPILAIFIKENLPGGTVFAAGFASTLFLITKCIIQLPFSRYIDSTSEKVKWVVLGTAVIAIVPFVYILAEHIYTIYVAQVIYGIGAGLAYPTWLSLWSINLDKKHEGFEWSLYSTLVGLGMAATAALGAGIAEYVGFKITFLLVGIFAVIGCLILLGLAQKHIPHKVTLERYHIKRKLINHH